MAAVPFVQIPATHACCVFHSRSAFVLSGYKKAQISLCCCVLLHDNIEETCSRQAQKQHNFLFKKRGDRQSVSVHKNKIQNTQDVSGNLIHGEIGAV